MTAPTDSTVFHIARIEYRVQSLACPIFISPDPHYESFAGPVRRSGWKHSIDITTRVAPPPAEDGWRTVFEAGETWRLAVRSDRRKITLAGGNPPEDLWSAVMDREARAVTVYCSERLIRRAPGGDRLENPVHYPLDQLLLFRALGARGILVHAAGAVLDGRGILLAGVSGAGKTTISRILSGHGSYRLLSDDRVVITGGKDGLYIHGTPWPGEGGFARDEAVPLAACLFLRKGDANRIHILPAAEALRTLLPVASIFWPDPDISRQGLIFCQAMIAATPCYDFSFTPEADAADFLARQRFP